MREGKTLKTENQPEGASPARRSHKMLRFHRTLVQKIRVCVGTMCSVGRSVVMTDAD